MLLAEPNLTTTSGEAASFLAGGEYPIPVPQDLDSVGIEYKQCGVSVGFTPTVLSSGMISMKVSPEVSELSQAGAYVIPGGGGDVPALITRRANTTVQLASGQSFAIGGLIQNDAQNNIFKIPWLGDPPILGALFRSTQFQRNETELVIGPACRPVTEVIRPAEAYGGGRRCRATGRSASIRWCGVRQLAAVKRTARRCVLSQLRVELHVLDQRPGVPGASGCGCGSGSGFASSPHIPAHRVDECQVAIDRRQVGCLCAISAMWLRRFCSDADACTVSPCSAVDRARLLRAATLSGSSAIACR